MNLPNYFLADLPADAPLSAVMLAEACDTLKRNRAHYLAGRSAQSLIRMLAELGRNWLDPEYPFRKMAIADCQAKIGFSPAVLNLGLNQFFSQLTEETLMALIAQDLGDPQRLDGFSASPAEQKRHIAAIAHGPELLGQLIAGNVPSQGLMSLVLGLLLRSAQFIQCPPGASALLRLVAHSIYEADPKLASCLEIAEWKDGSTSLEDALFAAVDCVTVTGSDEVLRRIRQRMPATVRLVSYVEAVSFGFIAQEVLSGFNPDRLISRAADDIVTWDQYGLGPHLFYAQLGGAISPDQFAEKLAAELAARETTHPPGPLSPEKVSMIATRRSFYHLRAAHSLGTRCWASANAPLWTVIYEEDSQFQRSCLNRLVYVKPVADLVSALRAADSVRGKTSTIGLACTEDKAAQFATLCARWGANRVCPIGQMQNPPLPWRRGGRPALGDLVTWTDWEQGL